MTSNGPRHPTPTALRKMLPPHPLHVPSHLPALPPLEPPKRTWVSVGYASPTPRFHTLPGDGGWAEGRPIAWWKTRSFPPRQAKNKQLVGPGEAETTKNPTIWGCLAERFPPDRLAGFFQNKDPVFKCKPMVKTQGGHLFTVAIPSPKSTKIYQLIAGLDSNGAVRASPTWAQSRAVSRPKHCARRLVHGSTCSTGQHFGWAWFSQIGCLSCCKDALMAV